ncbi:MAG: SDR family NAD(P)-dependent oxidoreductase [Planctomycetales bacterium]|nr:SDR family NAD(P)-dependent oxidoreductase [Planctomycetales bacterium]
MATAEPSGEAVSPVIPSPLVSGDGDASRTGKPCSLVTGASGFIGMALARRLLSDGKRVRIYVRNPAAVTELQQQGAEVVAGDLDDPEGLLRALQGADTVYHLAAMTSATDVKRMLRVNGKGTYNVARACAAQSCPPVLVYVSSISAGGPTTRGQLRRESDPPAPISAYGRSKLAGERAVARFAAKVPTTIVRLAIVYGPRDHEMLPIFKTIQQLRVHPVAGWHTPLLSFIYLDDVTELLIRAAHKGSRLPPPCGNVIRQLTAGGGVYFGSGTEHLDYEELGRLLKGLLNRPQAPIVHIPPRLAWLLASIHELTLRLQGTSDTFNRDKIQEALAESWACSCDLAERDLDFVPQHSLAEQLKATIVWYQENGWL